MYPYSAYSMVQRRMTELPALTDIEIGQVMIKKQILNISAVSAVTAKTAYIMLSHIYRCVHNVCKLHRKADTNKHS